jgi:hypothetical protein
MREAPVSVQRGKVDLHVVAPLAQVLFKLKMNKIIGVVEGEIGDVDCDWLAGEVIVITAQGVAGNDVSSFKGEVRITKYSYI